MRFCRLFLIVMLCFVVCIGLFSVSAFAEEIYYVYGQWTFLNLDTSLAPLKTATDYYLVNFTCNGASYVAMKQSFSSAGYTFLDFYSKLEDGSFVTAGTFGSPLVEKYSVIDFGVEPQSVSKDFYLWLTSVAEPPKCDGSVCSATDANKDNICDDCGLVFAVLRDYSPMDVSKLMSSIVSIFNSCITWVKSVGSTIMEKPILLFYAALPLCGIGVGFFKRLKS